MAKPTTDKDDNTAYTTTEQRRQAFGERLQDLMRARDMTQSDLARAADLGRDSISGYVLGRNLPTPKNMRALAKALGVVPQELYAVLSASNRRAAPAFSISQVDGQPGKAWVSINRVMPYGVAVKIARILEDVQEE